VPRRQAWLARSGAIAALAGGTYLLANLLQTVYPNTVILTLGGARRGDFSNNLLAANTSALPSVLLPVAALLLGAVLAVLWAGQRLVGHRDPLPWDEPPAPDPVRLLHHQAGLLLLATPFIGLAAWGALRLVVDTPGGRDGDPYRIVLPLVALLLLALLASAAIKAWQVVRYLREPRAAPLCEEAWTGAGRAELWLVGALAAVCLAASFLRPIQLTALETGQTFGSDLRRHVQFLLLALLPLLPALRLHRDGQRLFAGPPTRATPPGRSALAWPIAAILVSLALAGSATFLLDGPVWGWVLASAPVAIAAQRLRPARLGTAALLLLAWSTWCVGNTLAARYDPTDAGLIQFYGSPGVLALWRLLGAVLAGLAMVRLARAAGETAGARLAWPMAASLGLCVIAIALLELPLSIWADSNEHGQFVYVGTAVASQGPAVQWVMHAIALAAAVASAVMLARLLRPGWSGRRGPRATPTGAARPIA
jgi:hypothetical protein